MEFSAPLQMLLRERQIFKGHKVLDALADEVLLLKSEERIAGSVGELAQENAKRVYKSTERLQPAVPNFLPALRLGSSKCSGAL
jgi:hypothetical protein